MEGAVGPSANVPRCKASLRTNRTPTLLPPLCLTRMSTVATIPFPTLSQLGGCGSARHRNTDDSHHRGEDSHHREEDTGTISSFPPYVAARKGSNPSQRPQRPHKVTCRRTDSRLNPSHSATMRTDAKEGTCIGSTPFQPRRGCRRRTRVVQSDMSNEGRGGSWSLWESLMCRCIETTAGRTTCPLPFPGHHAARILRLCHPSPLGARVR